MDSCWVRVIRWEKKMDSSWVRVIHWVIKKVPSWVVVICWGIEMGSCLAQMMDSSWAPMRRWEPMRRWKMKMDYLKEYPTGTQTEIALETL
eukprot:scaffold545_cov139-Skeletonema_menzelii.AAC.6